MGVGSQINATQHLRLKVLEDFADILLRKQVNYAKRNGDLFKEINTKLRYVEEALWKSVPIFRYWPMGTTRARRAVEDILVTLYHYPWELTLAWLRWDEEDISNSDKISRLLEAQADRALQLPDIFVAEYLAQVASVYPALSLTYDGAALLSATDGAGAARAGVTGGNIITGSGVATTADFIHDLFQARTRFTQMTDTESQPYFEAEDVDFSKFLVVCSPALLELAEQVANMETLYGDRGVNTAVDNVVLRKGKFELWVNQRLSGNDWFVILKNQNLKPFVRVVRSDLEQQLEDESNSDRSRDVAERASLAHMRIGVAPYAPQTIIKVDN